MTYTQEDVERIKQEVQQEKTDRSLVDEHVVQLMLKCFVERGEIGILPTRWRETHGTVYITLPSGSTPDIVNEVDPYTFWRKTFAVYAMLDYLNERWQQGVIQKILYDFQHEVIP